MCTGLEIPLILTGVGVAANVAKSWMAGDAAADAQERQAEIDRQNAAAAEEQEMLTRRRTEVKVAKVKEAGARLMGKQQVTLGNNNLDVSTGSAAEILEGTAETVGEEVSVVRYNGIAEAYGYHVAGKQFSAQAAAHQQASEDAELAKWLAIGADVLTGGAKMAQLGFTPQAPAPYQWPAGPPPEPPGWGG